MVITRPVQATRLNSYSNNEVQLTEIRRTIPSTPVLSGRRIDEAQDGFRTDAHCPAEVHRSQPTICNQAMDLADAEMHELGHLIDGQQAVRDPIGQGRVGHEDNPSGLLGELVLASRYASAAAWRASRRTRAIISAAPQDSGDSGQRRAGLLRMSRKLRPRSTRK